MEKLLQILSERRSIGLKSILVTIADSTTHVPRHAGSYMLVGEEGRLYGTIGGGMLEFRCIQMAKDMLAYRESGLRKFCLAPNEVADLGMICGGNVEVLFTLWLEDERYARVCEQLIELLKEHRQCWWALPLDGSIPFALIARPDEFEDGRVRGRTEAEGKPCFVERLGTSARVYIFGGGHLAQELVPLLAHLGFRCVVTDDRREFSEEKLFPGAEEVRTEDYSRLADSGILLQKQDYVCIMTRGHLGDTDCERFAMNSSVSYIGVVGSECKVATVRQKLLKEGYSQADLDRVDCPIGIDIHSETPAEIAVSIAAQLIEHRAKFSE
ncbi:XdhC family protein [Clostridium sp. KNHs216]|uniref:XdhC family protein n=1 Tax=Clostridium sp. KNHs216 TaxID=1550235 RepID=UPI00116A1114|nr:XdhC family protein [Clostridium sp. KNHs216]TQI68613.1 xanthine dehydrogenase accessory factor [Clostridium sp. KNHs216]